MAAPPSSGLNAKSAETVSKKLHPYQKCGSAGAYDSREVVIMQPNGHLVRGLYVRVDMPGVPNDGIEVVKNSETRTFNFTGKAPKLWPTHDTSDRVYSGYVLLDRDPAEVEVETYVNHGCVRFFFPFCDGLLHFLFSPDTAAAGDQSPGILLPEAEAEDEGTVVFVEGLGSKYVTIVEHAPDSSGLKLRGGKPVHINPYLVSGMKGVYEHKIVSSDGGEQLVYMRLDVPAVGCECFILGEKRGPLTYSADGVGEVFPYDEIQRGFIAEFKPNCSCCKYEVAEFDVKDGVIRILARKTRNSAVPPTKVHCYEAPSRPGEAPKKHSMGFGVELHGNRVRFVPRAN